MPSSQWIRSTLFNVIFYTMTTAFCILYIPLIAAPRSWLIAMLRVYMRLLSAVEKHVAGITLEIRGREHLPPPGTAFLVAAKHQSPYETMKLHLILDDPAVILKKELTQIPIWGWLAQKADQIPVDRSNPARALKSITDGARRIAAQNRPIVIFPQGTRVRVHETTSDKPYKSGIIRMQAQTNLPIVPMALNSGLFWPRDGWRKYPGTVVFEFLPPIPPGGDPKDTLRTLETLLEARSQALIDESQKKISG